jgi:hypothetical protein
MNLKKSDKIIAAAAVVILIIAAIGVILYTDTEPDDKIPEEDELIVYKVNVEERSGVLSLDNSEYTMKNKKPYVGTFEVSSDNLKGVDIYVEYEDKDPGFLFKKGRQNTITITVYDENENEVGSKQITGKGNETISVFCSSPINIYEIKAKDMNDAEEKLDENLSTTGLTQTYTLEVSVKHGESILRPIMWLLEKLGKDSFTPEITYNYYYYNLEEEYTNNDDLVETGLTTSMPKTYSTLGLPGKN